MRSCFVLVKPTNQARISWLCYVCRISTRLARDEEERDRVRARVIEGNSFVGGWRWEENKMVCSSLRCCFTTIFRHRCGRCALGKRVKESSVFWPPQYWCRSFADSDSRQCGWFGGRVSIKYAEELGKFATASFRHSAMLMM